MAFANTRPSIVSAAGVDSDTAISASNWTNNTYDGVGERNDYTHVGASLEVNEAGILTFESSTDDSVYAPFAEFVVRPGVGEVRGAWKREKWFRVKFVGVGGRTYFRLSTVYSYQTLASTPLVGETPSGTLENVNVSYNGSIPVIIDSPLTSFGELKSSEIVQRAAFNFCYNIAHDQEWVLSSDNGPTPDCVNGMLRVRTSGGTLNSSSTATTLEGYKYNAGIGSLARFTALFSGPGGNSARQEIGMGTLIDGFFVGFGPNSEFGVLHRNASVDTWTPQTSWNCDPADGSKELPVLDITKGNVFQISFQYLGFGLITFSIENPVTGKFVTVHTIQYANQNTVPSLTVPHLPFRMFVDSNNDATGPPGSWGISQNTQIIQCASVGVFSEGHAHEARISYTHSTLAASVSTPIVMLTLKSRDTFNSLQNYISSFLRNITVTSESKTVVIKAYLGGTATTADGGLTDVNTTYSTMQQSTVTDTISGGALIATIVCAKDSASATHFDLGEIPIRPGNTMHFVANAPAGTAENVSISVRWAEDQ